jgi:hypothetical protein
VQANNVPHVNASSVNFQVRAGIAVPSSVTIASVSTYPALIDVFPAYRDDSFFVVEDEVVIVDRDRRIVDVVPVGPRARFAGASHGGSASSGSTVAVVDLPPDDIRVIQRVLIERGILHGEADGVWGPETREAITVYQRQQGIAVTGSIDMRTVSSLGVSSRLSQQASQSIQSQSSSTGAQTSTGTQTSTDTRTSTSQGQNGTGTAQSQRSQPSNQQDAAGHTPNQPSSTTGQSMPSQSSTGGQANQRSQSGSTSTANQPSANQSAPPSSGSGSNKN